MNTLARPAQPSMPRALSGFNGINRFWDRSAKTWVAQVLPGDFYVTRHPEVITTVLGSCVSTCMRDPDRQVGGINHFMLPAEPDRATSGVATRYGLYALERLINEIIKHGGRRDALEIKVFGGGRMISGLSDVGLSNINFVRQYLADEGLPVSASDLGGTCARRLRYYPLTGQVLVKHLSMQEATGIAGSEQEHRARLAKALPTGDVELF